MPPPTLGLHCKSVFYAGGAFSNTTSGPKVVSSGLGPKLPPRDPLWEGACPRWRRVSRLINNCHTVIGGKPPPTLGLHCKSVFCAGGAFSNTTSGPKVLSSRLGPKLPPRDPLWKGACPRWRWVSRLINNCHTVIGGKPPPTLGLHCKSVFYAGGAFSNTTSGPKVVSSGLGPKLPPRDPLWEGACPR